MDGDASIGAVCALTSQPEEPCALCIAKQQNHAWRLVWGLLSAAVQASLVPAFVLTAVSIVTSMKLATYAHCNTALRREARTRAVGAAAAGWPVPTTTVRPVSFTNGSGSGSGSGGFWRQNKASLIAPAGLTTAATHTAAAAVANSSSNGAALRSSATDPSPFMAAGLRRTSSLSRRQVAAGVVMKDTVYPSNLNAADLAYFLAAPTLTYQLNFPKLRQRRWRLLSRWLLLAVLTAIAMSFMQVRGQTVLLLGGCLTDDALLMTYTPVANASL
jgi:hypothetical protein